MPPKTGGAAKAKSAGPLKTGGTPKAAGPPPKSSSPKKKTEKAAQGNSERKEIEEVVDTLFKLSDADKSGVIEFGEFLEHHRSVMASTDCAGGTNMNDASLQARFREHDTDNSQTLDMQEFRSYMDGVLDVLGKRKFLDICRTLISETTSRIEALEKAYDATSGLQLVQKTRNTRRFVADLEDQVMALLAKRADPNYPDDDRGTPLLYAADKSEAAFIRKLLTARANPMLHNKDWDCAAFRAARIRNREVLRMLLLDQGSAPPPDAASREKVKASDELVRHMAVHTGADVLALLRKGADINHQTDAGWTPLTAAVCWGSLEAAEALLKNANLPGKDKLQLDVKNGKGRGPLHIAARKGRVDFIVPLLRARCDVDMQDTDGWTALHHAAFNSCSDCACALMEKNANLHIQGLNGLTPYMLTKLPQTVGPMTEKAMKWLEPPECLNFAKAVLPLLKDDQLTTYGRIEAMMDFQGVLSNPQALRWYDQCFDFRHGPNKVRLQKLWESIGQPMIWRQLTGETDLPPPDSSMAQEAIDGRIRDIQCRRRDQDNFLLQWFRDTKGPRRTHDWQHENREVYKEELTAVVTDVLAQFRQRLDDLYSGISDKPQGGDLVNRPAHESFGTVNRNLSQLQAHSIPIWLQQMDPGGAFNALRSVGAHGMGKNDETSMLLFVDLLINHLDFETGEKFWQNVYRLWLTAYAKLADADFKSAVRGLVEKFNKDNKDDRRLQVMFKGVAPKTYLQTKAKEERLNVQRGHTYESRTAAANVLDIVRCSITVREPRTAVQLIDEVFQPLTIKSNKMELLQLENRFSSQHPCDRLMGYRNIELRVLIDLGTKLSLGGSEETIPVKVIGEVQIVFQEFLEVRKNRHLIFKYTRGEYDWPAADNYSVQKASLEDHDDD